MIDLLPAQKEAIDKLQLLKVGALFKRPGTGKTRDAIELVRSAPVDQVLWAAPLRSIYPHVAGSGIRDEIAKWGGFDVPVKYVGVESLSQSDRIYLNTRNYVESANTFIVMDESLKIKNFQAKRTRRVVDLGKLSEFKLILNGTPISRNLLDIWSQFEFLSPKILKMSMSEYKNTFCEWVKLKYMAPGRYNVREFIVAYHNVEYLYSLIRPYVYEAELQLEVGKQHIDINYSIESEIVEKYNKLKEKYLDDATLMAMNNNIFIEMTQKMQHLYSCAKEKFEIIKRIIKRHGGEKVVIFCKFVDSREMCEKLFGPMGATVLSIQSDSMSINLQDRSVCIEADKTWDFALVDQYQHRIYRQGQKEECFYYYLNGNVGLDRLIKENNEKKSTQLQCFNRITKKGLKEVL